MTDARRADFYILNNRDEYSRLEFSCRLANKLTALGHCFTMLTDQLEQARMLDNLLWEMPAEGFLPHLLDTDQCCIHSENASNLSPVVINLRSQTPPLDASCNRVAEIVVQQAEILASTRKNFLYYRNLGWTVNSHTIA